LLAGGWWCCGKNPNETRIIPVYLHTNKDASICDSKKEREENKKYVIMLRAIVHCYLADAQPKIINTIPNENGGKKDSTDKSKHKLVAKDKKK